MEKNIADKTRRIIDEVGGPESAAILAQGKIGKITSVHATHMQILPKEPTHRINSIELAGGALLDLGVYPVSFAFDLLGPPIAMSTPQPPDQTRGSGIHLKHRQGAAVTLT